jgi:hypothetical protein
MGSDRGLGRGGLKKIAVFWLFLWRVAYLAYIADSAKITRTPRFISG